MGLILVSYHSVFITVAVVRAGIAFTFQEPCPVVFIHINAAEIFFEILIIRKESTGIAAASVCMSFFLHLKCGYSLSLIGSCLFVILLFFV